MKNFFFYIKLNKELRVNKFMSENLTSNNIKNDILHENIEENDYHNLITRLKEIKTNIVLLEKTIFR